MNEEAPPFKLVAGHVALDFANTLDNRYDPGRRVDLIATYPEFLRFCVEAAVVTPRHASKLARLEQGTGSGREHAGELREAVYRIFVRVVEKLPATETDLEILSRYVREAARHRALVSKQPGAFSWQWIDLEAHASGPLWPIAEAAADLLLSDDLHRLRQCASDTCRWLFLDTSKNHSRRWCDMRLCGNRIKARNYYQRGREHGAG